MIDLPSEAITGVADKPSTLGRSIVWEVCDEPAEEPSSLRFIILFSSLSTMDFIDDTVDNVVFNEPLNGGFFLIGEHFMVNDEISKF